jgi:hypothetical protein
MATRALNVVITGDSKGIGLAAREADGHLKAVQRSAKVTGAALKVGFGVAAGGILVGVSAMKKSVKAARTRRPRWRGQASVKASGISYRAHAKEIDKVIQKHSRLTGFDDEDLAGRVHEHGPHDREPERGVQAERARGGHRQGEGC